MVPTGATFEGVVAVVAVFGFAAGLLAGGWRVLMSSKRPSSSEIIVTKIGITSDQID